MTMTTSKTKAREDLELALVSEARAWRRLGRTATEMMEQISHSSPMLGDRASADEAAAATKAAIDAFATACEEETRAGIADWIAAAPARMEAQAAAGAQSLHYMHDIGQLAAAAGLAEAIRNKVDLEEDKPGR